MLSKWNILTQWKGVKLELVDHPGRTSSNIKNSSTDLKKKKKKRKSNKHFYINI